MNQKICLLAAMLTIAAAIHAGKAKPGLRTAAQPDGTTLEYYAIGDEDFHYIATPDGTLLVGTRDGFYIAEVNADGTLTATRQLAHNAITRQQDEQALADSQDRTTFYAMSRATAAKAKTARREQMTDDGTLFPHTGSPKAVVLLVEFSDVQFTLDTPDTLFNRYLNADDYFGDDDTEMGATEAGYEQYRNYGSVRRYFEDMSFGDYTPQFDIYGPYTIDYATSSFAGTSHMSLLLQTACEAADSDVDFSQYDDNEDGYIDLVYIIYAGYAQSITGVSTDIWPNSGTISNTTTFDGKKIRRYGVNSELNFDSSYPVSINGIGLFCHEFSHCLGLPDLYPSSSGTAEADNYFNQNLEYWSLMDAGEYTLEGYRPTAYTAWERERMGWLDIEELTEAADLTIEPLNKEGETAQNGNAYRIRNDENSDEYYILENIQLAGWNAELFGHGLTVMHVDYDDDYFQMSDMPNAEGGHPRMTLIPADNLLVPVTYLGETITDDVAEYSETAVEKYLGQTITTSVYVAEFGGDPFPGTSANTSLTDETTPAATVFTTSGDNPGYMGKPLTNIAESDDGVITLTFMESSSDTGISLIEAPDTEPSHTIYSIDGRRMANSTETLQKGVYIIGGKKKIVR